MPLPPDPLTIRGGCNCRAIRYRIDIPPASQRPLHPWSDKPVHLPNIVICHCNDCRRATANLALAGLCTPTDMVSVSLLPRSSTLPPLSSVRVELPDDNAARDWVPASTVFAPSIAPPDSFLTIYKSSEAVSRTFCARCGTPLTFSRYPMREPWPEMLDILLGTVDRRDLENSYMAPDRHIRWNTGIEWVRRLFNGGSVMAKHPLSNLSDTVE